MFSKTWEGHFIVLLQMVAIRTKKEISTRHSYTFQNHLFVPTGYTTRVLLVCQIDHIKQICMP